MCNLQEGAIALIHLEEHYCLHRGYPSLSSRCTCTSVGVWVFLFVSPPPSLVLLVCLSEEKKTLKTCSSGLKLKRFKMHIFVHADKAFPMWTRAEIGVHCSERKVPINL